MAVPARDALLASVEERHQRLHERVTRILDTARQRADYAQRSLAVPRAPVRGLALRVQALHQRGTHALAKGLGAPRLRMARLAQRLAHRRPVVESGHARVRAATGQLQGALRASMNAWSRRVVRAGASLQALDPAAVLARGFAIAYAPDGQTVRDARTLSIGDQIRLQFARGRARARIDDLGADGDDKYDWDDASVEGR
jgi:exodeoxyribonuclease VII large subunit